MSHQTIHHRQKENGRRVQTKKLADIVNDFFSKLLVSVVNKNAPIWLSHSPNIKGYKGLFLLSFEDIKLMYYVILYDPTLLHQTNEYNNNVY